MKATIESGEPLVTITMKQSEAQAIANALFCAVGFGSVPAAQEFWSAVSEVGGYETDIEFLVYDERSEIFITRADAEEDHGV